MAIEFLLKTLLNNQKPAGIFGFVKAISTATVLKAYMDVQQLEERKQAMAEARNVTIGNYINRLII